MTDKTNNKSILPTACFMHLQGLLMCQNKALLIHFINKILRFQPLKVKFPFEHYYLKIYIHCEYIYIKSKSIAILSVKIDS